jgi:protein-disulfide isomerase
MRVADRASLVVGWLFLIGAGVMLVLPGGAVRGWWLERREVSRVRQMVVRGWADLESGTGLIGSGTSSVRLVEFVDYQCTYCRSLHDTLAAFLSQTGYAQEAVAIRQLPRIGDGRSRGAALSAICANAQGMFAEMHVYLLTDDGWRSTSDVEWREVGRRIGVPDLDRFEACLRSEKAVAMLRSDSVWARRLGLRGTPVLLSQLGGLHTGMARMAEIEKLVGMAHSARLRR